MNASVLQWIDKAKNEAYHRPDRNMLPKVQSVYCEVNNIGVVFLLVDVQYSSKGFCALYEVNLSRGSMVLAQD